jgi:hypothetical protein
MTALTARTAAHRTLLAPPTALERLLLGSSRALEAIAVARMERRRTPRTAGAAQGPVADAIERRRDVTAAAHSGLLPR